FDNSPVDASGHGENAVFYGNAQWSGDSPLQPTPAPTIAALGTSEAGPSAATIVWTTDTPSTSQVVYGSQRTAVDPSLVTAHSVRLGALSPSTDYDLQV